MQTITWSTLSGIAIACVCLFCTLLPKIETLARTNQYSDFRTNVYAGLALSSLLAVLSLHKHRNRITRWARNRLLPINTRLPKSALECLHQYARAVNGRIVDDLATGDLQNLWVANANSRYLIPFQAEILRGARSAPLRTSSTADLLEVIDRELFGQAADPIEPYFVQGEPGSGKSTLFFELFRRHSYALREGMNFQGWIPILVFAHDLTAELLNACDTPAELLIEYHKRRARAYDTPTDRRLADLLSSDFRSLRLPILIDGLDEITDRTAYADMVRRLNVILKAESSTPAHQGNRYIISCRTEDNQHLITSRLITLLAPDRAVVCRFFAHIESELPLEAAYSAADAAGVFGEVANQFRGLTETIVSEYPWVKEVVREASFSDAARDVHLSPESALLTDITKQLLSGKLDSVLLSCADELSGFALDLRTTRDRLRSNNILLDLEYTNAHVLLSKWRAMIIRDQFVSAVCLNSMIVRA